MVLKYNVPPWRAFVVFIMSYLQGFMAYGTIVLAAPFYVLYLGDRGEYGAGDFSDPDLDVGIATCQGYPPELGLKPVFSGVSRYLIGLFGMIPALGYLMNLPFDVVYFLHYKKKIPMVYVQTLFLTAIAVGSAGTLSGPTT